MLAPRSLPPGPHQRPALQLLRWIRDPFALLRDADRQFGEIFTLRVPGRAAAFVVVSNPEMVKRIFALDGNEAHAGKANAVLKPFLGVHSLLVLDGPEHVRQRRMMLPAFHGDRMHAYGHVMLELAHRSIDDWPTGAPFPVHRRMQSITLQIILRTVFGVESGPRFRELEQILARALDIAAWPMLLFPFMQRDWGRYSPWGRFRALSARASTFLRREIADARRRGTTGRSDVLAMLVEARDDTGQPLTDDEVHDELVTLLIAGHETTATALAWTLRWVLPNASLVERLRSEMRTAGQDPAAIAKLELLDATVRESLRLQPVLPLVGRVLLQPLRLGDYDLPTGTAVAASIYLVHRRPSLYPSPERFDPDRFRTLRPTPWEWLPFGGGLRRCIGAAFALYEMKMVLAAILPRIDAHLVSDDVRATRRSVTITPARGLPITVTARRPEPPCPPRPPSTR